MQNARPVPLASFYTAQHLRCGMGHLRRGGTALSPPSPRGMGWSLEALLSSPCAPSSGHCVRS